MAAGGRSSGWRCDAPTHLRDDTEAVVADIRQPPDALEHVVKLKGNAGEGGGSRVGRVEERHDGWRGGEQLLGEVEGHRAVSWQREIAF